MPTLFPFLQCKKTSYNFVLVCLLIISSVFFNTLRADIFVRDDIITAPDKHRFSMCHGHGCKEVEQLSLSDTEWQRISRHFQPAATSAAIERIQIAQAIAEFEQIIGKKTGTANDKAGLFPAMGQAGQLDCIDESTNTTTYLLILQKQNMLRWHEPMDHVTRGFFFFGWPHSSAAMRETSSTNIENPREFAVDSWFEDNGQRPHIISLSKWRSGWKPQ